MVRAGLGLGLGLSLVQGLIKLHGGTVTAQSDGVGCGSTLRVTLPLCRMNTKVAAGSEPAAPRAAQKVLIVEDNPDAAARSRP